MSQLNLTAHCLGRFAERTPLATALIVDSADGVASFTYDELQHTVLVAASAFADLAAGSRVLIALPDSLSFVLAFFGANAAGMVPIPASAQLTERELSFIASAAKVSAIVCDEPGVLADSNCPRLTSNALRGNAPAQYAATNAESPAYILFTSGTTSQPKGVVHAQRVVLGREPMHQHWLGLTPQDRMLHAGALNWSYTLGVGLMDPWCCGATAIVCPGGRKAADWPATIARHHATVFAAVPGVYRQLLRACSHQQSPSLADQLSSLRHAVNGWRSTAASAAGTLARKY